MATSDSSLAPRPPKLGPRKSGQQSQQKSKDSNQTPDARSRPPKLGPRKSSAQASSVTKPKPQRQESSTAANKQNIESVPEDAPQSSADTPLSKPKLKGLPKLGPRKPNAVPETHAEDSAKGKAPQQEPTKANVPEDAPSQTSTTKREDETSLTTMLDIRQRTQLTILLAAATATMRDNLSAAFEAEPAD